MANLNVNIGGDCSGAMNALNNVQSGIRDLDGTQATTSVAVAGADAAVNAYGRVAQARDQASGDIQLGVSGLGELQQSRGEVQGLEADTRSLQRQLGGVSAATVMGIQDDGSIAKAAQGLGQLSRGLSAVVSSSEDLGSVETQSNRVSASVTAMGGSATQTGAQYQQMATTVEASSTRVSASVDSASVSMNAQNVSAGSLSQTVGSLALAHNDLADAGEVSAASMGQVENSLASTGTTAARASGQINSMTSSLQGALKAQNALSGTGSSSGGSGGSASNVLTPNFTRRGGPGGGPPTGGGTGGAAGAADDLPELAGPTGSDFFSGISSIAGPAMMGSMIGVGVTALTAAVGVGSVVEAMKYIPGAMAAATQATGQFDKGLASAVKGASVGKEEFAGLGQALGGLGSVVGQVGLQNMNAVIGGATSLATTATSALKDMEPAIGPAISGMVGLGNAILTGISSPSSVAGIASVGQALSDPGNEKGISNVVSGVVALSSAVTDFTADAAGMLAPLGSGAMPATLAGMAGMVAGGVKGGATGAGLGGLVGGVGGFLVNKEMESGIDPGSTIMGGITGYSLMSQMVAKGGPLAAIGGSAATAGEGIEDAASASKLSGAFRAGGALGGMALTGLASMIPGQAGTVTQDALGGALGGADAGAMIGGLFGPEGIIPGALIGAGAGAIGGLIQGLNSAPSTGAGTPAGAGTQGMFPTGQGALNAGQYGWTADSQGNLTPSNTPYGGGGQVVGGGTPSAYTPGTFQGGTPPPAPATDTNASLNGPTTGGGLNSLLNGQQTQAPVGPQIPTGSPGTNAMSPSAIAQTQQLAAANTSLAGSYSQVGGSASSSSAGVQQQTQNLNNQSQSYQNVTQSATNAQPAVDAHTQSLTQATQAAQQLQQAAPAAQSAVQSVAPAATQAMASTATQVQSGGNAIGQAITGAVAGGVAGSTGVACAASSQMAASMSNCTASTLQTASPSKVFTKLGESTGQGLALGVHNSMGDASDAVHGMAKGMVAAGAKGLDAHSPSEEFADLGSFAGAGLQLGFERNSDGTIAAVSNTTQAMMAAHEDAWNPNAATLPNPTYEDSYPLRPDTSVAPAPTADLLSGVNPYTVAQQQAQANYNATAAQGSTTGMTPTTTLTAAQVAAIQQGGPAAINAMAAANAKGLETSLGMSSTSADLVAGQETTHTLNAMALQGNIAQDKAAAQYGAMHDMTPAQASQVLAGMPNNPEGSNAAWVGQPGANGAVDPSQLGGHAMPAGTAGGPVMPGTSTAAPSSLPPGLTGFSASTPTMPNPYGGSIPLSGPPSGIDPNIKSTGFGDPSAGQNAAGVRPTQGTGNQTPASPAAGGSNPTPNNPAQGQAAGGGFGSGFAQGIENAASTAFNSATNLASGAVAAVTTFLGIKSPSRVMMGHGEMTSEGFARGIRDSNGPGRAMREMVRDAIHDGQDEWGRDWWNGWGGPGGPGGGGSGSSGGSSSGGGSGSGSGLGGPWGWSHGLGGWGHHGWGHHGHHGDDHHGHHDDHHHDDHHDDHHGDDHHGGFGDDTDRMAERFADRLGDRLGGRGFGGGGGAHDEGRGWGHGGWGGGWGGWGGGHDWASVQGGMGGSGSGDSAAGGNPPYTGMNPWWAQHPDGGGGHGWGHHGWGHDDHHGHHDDDHHGHHDDHHHERHHDRDRHDEHMHMPGIDHLGADNMPEINSQSHEMGQAVAQGMAQGMQQNQSSVTQAAAAMAVTAVSTVRSSLGIASPSKVFYEIGGDAVKGFSHGLTTGVSVIAENSQSLSSIATEQMAQGLATGKVNQGYSIGLNRWLTGLKVGPNFMPFSDWEFDESQLGALGSGVQAAMDGTKSIADSSGLQVGNIWARSITTGADNVLQTSLFSALSSPAVGSALAETALGAAGQLGPAGSGAEYYNVSSGSAGLVSMGSSAQQPVVVTVNTMLDGSIIDSKIDTKITTNNRGLINAIMGARG